MKDIALDDLNAPVSGGFSSLPGWSEAPPWATLRLRGTHDRVPAYAWAELRDGRLVDEPCCCGDQQVRALFGERDWIIESERPATDADVERVAIALGLTPAEQEAAALLRHQVHIINTLREALDAAQIDADLNSYESVMAAADAHAQSMSANP